MRSRSHGRRGSVLLIILVVVTFASAALLVFMEKASNDLLVATRAADASRLRLEAYSALETTIAVLEEFRQVNGGLRSPAEGWDDPLAFAGYAPAEGRTVEIRFEDESGKLSLPTLDAPALVQLFVGWGMKDRDAEKLADALLGWMKPDFVPSTAGAPRAEDYDRGELPYVPPARALRSFEELAAIEVAREFFYDEKGRPNEFWHKFHEAVSLYRYAQPNLNAAGADALAALSRYDLSQQRVIGDFLSGKGARANRGPSYFKSIDEATNLLGAQNAPTGFGVEIRALRVRVRVSQGVAVYELNTVLSPPGGAQIVLSNPNPPGRSRGMGGGAEKPTPTPTPNRSSPAGAGKGGGEPGAKQLKYPFTLLEIGESVGTTTPTPPPEPAL